MKRVIFGIFAHPDDEAFGPAGALLTDVKNGADLHLVTLTAGEGGTNPDNHPNLGAVRLKEWQAAGALLGASSMHHLGYIDGTLGNLNMIEVQQRIISIVQTTAAQYSEPITIEFVTIDLNGVTGHVDHIVAARSASFAFYTLKASGLPLSKIRYACLPLTPGGGITIDWLFMEPGRSLDEINQTVDARQYFSEVEQIMRCHRTQRHDAQNHLNALGDKVAICHFIVRE